MSRRDHAAPQPPAEEDRRDSHRVPIRLLVRETALGGSFEERSGNLSLGGVYFTDGHPPFGTRVELRFMVPGARGEVRCEGDILRVTRAAGGFGAHVRFQQLPLETELAIARYLEKAER
jgi:uncharacterized protein (TIGR02266 family)